MKTKNLKWMMVAGMILTVGTTVAAETLDNVNEKNIEVNTIVYADVPTAESIKLIKNKNVSKKENKVKTNSKKETTETKVAEQQVRASYKADQENQKVAEEVPLETVSHQGSQEQQGNSVKPMTINMAGQSISYQNGGQSSGQSIIDNDGNMVSTWGGQAVQNGNDGLCTHFIGHNPGIFSVLFNLSVGSQVEITDANGNGTMYAVSRIFQADDYGTDIATGEDNWDLITGSNNGEMVVFQTCITDSTNLIVVAQ